MPGYKIHMLGGVCGFAILLHYGVSEQVSLLTYFEWMLFAILGSLFPDVDICSISQRFFYTIALFLIAALFLFGNWFVGAILSFLSFLPLIVKHRGIFHKLWFLGPLVFMCMFFLNKSFPYFKPMIFWDFLFFSVGLLSHIIFDFKHRLFIRR